jgi:hypothetical protein
MLFGLRDFPFGLTLRYLRVNGFSANSIGQDFLDDLPNVSSASSTADPHSSMRAASVFGLRLRFLKTNRSSVADFIQFSAINSEANPHRRAALTALARGFEEHTLMPRNAL